MNDPICVKIFGISAGLNHEDYGPHRKKIKEALSQKLQIKPADVQVFFVWDPSLTGSTKKVRIEVEDVPEKALHPGDFFNEISKFCSETFAESFPKAIITTKVRRQHLPEGNYTYRPVKTTP